ncbi:MAG: hypothetical protein WC985_03755 [Thermoplasmata archaeon]
MDLRLLAAGFGIMPMGAILLVFLEGRLRSREALVWGALIGIVAFLGIAHAAATILELDSQFTAGAGASAVTLALGLLLGLGLGWVLLGRTTGGGVSFASRVAWAALVFLALHSVSDGQVLGEAYAGPLPLGWTLTPLIVSATFVHRFAEGALVVVPALVASWRPVKSLGLLTVGLLALPAAYLPVALFASGYSSATLTADQATLMFVSSLKMGIAFMLILIGLLPRVVTQKDPRWAVAAGLAFLAMFLVHFAVE